MSNFYLDFGFSTFNTADKNVNKKSSPSLASSLNFGFQTIRLLFISKMSPKRIEFFKNESKLQGNLKFRFWKRSRWQKPEPFWEMMQMNFNLTPDNWHYIALKKNQNPCPKKLSKTAFSKFFLLFSWYIINLTTTNIPRP